MGRGKSQHAVGTPNNEKQSKTKPNTGPQGVGKRQVANAFPESSKHQYPCLPKRELGLRLWKEVGGLAPTHDPCLGGSVRTEGEAKGPPCPSHSSELEDSLGRQVPQHPKHLAQKRGAVNAVGKGGWEGGRNGWA